MKRLGKIKTLAVASLATVALAVPIALAQDGGAQDKQPGGGWHKREGRGGRRGGEHFGGGRMGGRMFRGIDLTEEQQTRLQQIHQSFGERTKGLREQLRAKHREVREANTGDTFNEALAAQKLTEAASLQAKLMGEQFRLRQESLSVLTSEQRTQLEQRREQFKGRRGERRGRGGAQPQQMQ
jgi:Spy/CpxP family protein refolding chaperone